MTAMESIDGFINKVIFGNCLYTMKNMPPDCIDLVVTSPPYWAQRRNYAESIYGGDPACEHDWESFDIYHDNMRYRGHNSIVGTERVKQGRETPFIPFRICKKCTAQLFELGLEADPKDYVKHLLEIFNEIKRVLKPSGSCFVVLGDTYYTRSGGAYLDGNVGTNEYVNGAGLPLVNELRGRDKTMNKSLCLTPLRFAVGCLDNGWRIRNIIPWVKPNPTPSSNIDRFTVDFEYIIFMVKNTKYYFKQQKEPTVDGKGMRNMRAVWHINTEPSPWKHYSTFPRKLVERAVKAALPPNGILMDPFCGAGTSLIVAIENGGRAIGMDANKKFAELAGNRLVGALKQK